MKLSEWKVLVVEDEADSMEMVRELLEYHGVQCMPVRTAELALERLQDIVPTLVIVDLALPGMDGWGLLNAIQADPRLQRVPRIAITAYHTAELADKAIGAGFDAYFPKPLEATSFVRELEGIVTDN